MAATLVRCAEERLAQKTDVVTLVLGLGVNE